MVRNRHASVPILAAKAAKLDEKGKSLLDQDERMVMEKEIRVAINATIQSVSSDGMLLSACGLQDEIEERKLQDRIKIVNIIHDALYCLVRIEHVHEMHDLIIKHLTTLPVEMLRFVDGSTVELPIKMEADAEGGPDWAHFSEDFGECVVEDEDEEEEEEDEEEEAPAPKKGKEKEKNSEKKNSPIKKAGGEGGPGIIASIVAQKV